MKKSRYIGGGLYDTVDPDVDLESYFNTATIYIIRRHLISSSKPYFMVPHEGSATWSDSWWIEVPQEIINRNK